MIAFIRNFSIATLSLLIVGCLDELSWMSPEPTPNETEVPVETSKETVWNWESFPVSDELTLATTPVGMQPKQSLDLNAETSGILTLKITEKVTNVKEGTLWAEMNVQKIAREAEKKEITKTLRAIENLEYNEIEFPEREAAALEAFEEAQKKVALLEKIRNAEAIDRMRKILGFSEADISDASLEKARQELALAEKKITFARQYEPEVRDFNTRLEDMEADGANKDFELLKSQSEYLIPFDGELDIKLPLVPGQKDYSVTSRQHLATLNDYSEIHAYLGVQNAGWISLEPESLRVVLKDRARTELNFLADRVIKNERNREQRFYLFSIALEDNANLRRLTGSTLDADLIHTLDKPCYIVPKLELSRYSLGRSTSREWDSMLKDLFPEAELLAHGLEHLAVHFPGLTAKNTKD